MTKAAVMLALASASGCLPEDDEVALATTEEGIHLGTPFPAENSGFVRLDLPAGGGCSGTLMANFWVLTARHCVDGGTTPGQITLTMGSQVRMGAELQLHPQFDVALVRASAPFAMNGSLNGFRRGLFPFPTASQTPGASLTCRGYGQTTNGNPGTFGTLTTAQLPIRGTNFTYWCGLWSTHFDLAMDPNAKAPVGQFLTPGDSGTSCLNTLPGGSQVVAGVASSGLNTPCGDQITDLVSAETFRSFHDWNATWWERPFQWLGGILTSGPAVASWGPQHVEIFARGTNSRIWTNSGAGLQPWSGWREFAPQVVSSDPAAIARAVGKLDVFVRMYPDDQFRHISWNGISWTEWMPLGGVFTSSPAVSSWGPNRLDVFGRGTDYALYHKSFNGTSWSPYWAIVDASPLESDPAAVSQAPNQIDVFALRNGGKMHVNSWNGTWWSGWRPIGTDVFSSAASAVSPAPGRLEVYARRASDNLLVRNRSTNGGVTWGAWLVVDSVPIGSAPDAVIVGGQTNVAATRLSDAAGLWLVTH